MHILLSYTSRDQKSEMRFTRPKSRPQGLGRESVFVTFPLSRAVFLAFFGSWPLLPSPKPAVWYPASVAHCLLLCHILLCSLP